MEQNDRLMPREKLLHYGAAALQDHELLAIFLRTGIKNCPVMQLSEQVLRHFGSLHSLMSADAKQFCAVKGLGQTQFIQLQACMEMSKRYLRQQLQSASVFADSEAARLYLQMELAHLEREVFWVLFLDNQHQLIKKEEMFLGTINMSAVYPREIVKSALKCNAAAVILAHNHPSGTPEPSAAERRMTRRIERACGLVEIRVLDHLIIGKGSYFSFLENDWLSL